MLVRFRKTGSRRYAVLVERERAPALVAHPAPGYDDFLPHDLLHFVAEAERGLEGAVFGQLAAGGDPGIFLPVEPELVAKWVRRRKLRPKSHPKGPSVRAPHFCARAPVVRDAAKAPAARRLGRYSRCGACRPRATGSSRRLARRDR